MRTLKLVELNGASVVKVCGGVFDSVRKAGVESISGRKISDSEWETIKTSIFDPNGSNDVFGQLERGNTANPLILFEQETDGEIPVRLVFFTVSNKLAELGLAKKSTGVSICVVTSDNMILFVRRSMSNGGNRGCPGPVAGFMKTVRSGMTLDHVVRENFLEECRHEVGVLPEEIGAIKATNYLSMETQDEVLVTVRIRLTSDEVLERAKNNLADGYASKMAEAEVAFATPEQIVDLFSDPSIRAYDAHAVCLILGAKSLGADVSAAFENFKNLPAQDGKAVFTELNDLVRKYGVKNNFKD